MPEYRPERRRATLRLALLLVRENRGNMQPMFSSAKLVIPSKAEALPGRADKMPVAKTHTVKGAEIVATVPDLRPIIPIVRSHHERWDGKGYPDGLGGEAISPLARVVALADAFDAMTSDRPYRKGMAPAIAFAEIEKQIGRQFDPSFAAAFLGMKDAIMKEMNVQATVLSPSKRVRVLTIS